MPKENMAVFAAVAHHPNNVGFRGIVWHLNVLTFGQLKAGAPANRALGRGRVLLRHRPYSGGHPFGVVSAPQSAVPAKRSIRR
jgi:hypothetical protein